MDGGTIERWQAAQLFRTLGPMVGYLYRLRERMLQVGFLWTNVAAMEMALLELLGQTAQRPVADFFGGARRRDIAVYYASGKRGNKPEEEVDYLRKLVAGSGARALKFRL